MKYACGNCGNETDKPALYTVVWNEGPELIVALGHLVRTLKWIAIILSGILGALVTIAVKIGG